MMTLVRDHVRHVGDDPFLECPAAARAGHPALDERLESLTRQSKGVGESHGAGLFRGLELPQSLRQVACAPFEVIDTTGLELYDLDADIGERRNLVEQFPEIVAELSRLADDARAELGDALTGAVGSAVREPGRLNER